MYTRKKKKLYIHLYKYTAKLDSIWRHKYTDNLQYCFTKQKLIYDLTVSKCAIQYIVHYSYTRFCTHKLIQIKINISLHQPYNFFAVWYACMCTKEVIPFFFFFSMFYIQLFTYFIHNICLTTSHFVFKNTFYRRSCKTKKWTFPSWSPQTSCLPEDSVIISMLVTGAGHRNCPTCSSPSWSTCCGAVYDLVLFNFQALTDRSRDAVKMTSSITLTLVTSLSCILREEDLLENSLNRAVSCPLVSPSKMGDSGSPSR